MKELFFDEDDKEEESNNAATQTQFRPPSTWMPLKGRDAALETYIKKVRTDMEHQLEDNINKRCKGNLPSAERKALQNLRQQTGIVIKPADKASAVVVLSKEDYISRKLTDK